MAARWLLVASLAACACPSGRHDVAIVASRAELAFQIDTCFADDRACDALCRAALGLGPEIRVDRCTIESETADSVSVRAIYVEPVACGG